MLGHVVVLVVAFVVFTPEGCRPIVHLERAVELDAVVGERTTTARLPTCPEGYSVQGCFAYGVGRDSNSSPSLSKRKTTNERRPRHIKERAPITERHE